MDEGGYAPGVSLLARASDGEAFNAAVTLRRKAGGMLNRVLLLPPIAAMMQRRAEAQQAAEVAAMALLRTHGSQALDEARRRADYARTRRDRARSEHWSQAALRIASTTGIVADRHDASALPADALSR